MGIFADSISALDQICNRPDGMLTDGENLYIAQAAAC